MAARLAFGTSNTVDSATWMRSAAPLLSILLAVLMVSPNLIMMRQCQKNTHTDSAPNKTNVKQEMAAHKQYRGILVPTTAAAAGPVNIHMNEMLSKVSFKKTAIS